MTPTALPTLHAVPGGRADDLRAAPGGVFVVDFEQRPARDECHPSRVAPFRGWRWTAEQLAARVARILRENEALEDFAALVAHELKAPLQAALLAEDPSRYLEDALDLVDGLLEAARSDPRETVFVSVAECLDRAAAGVGAKLEVAADLSAELPLPPVPLRVILRNLLSNAAAAGAHHVRVVTVRSSCSWRLFLDDDGVGLEEVDRYAAGSGLGLVLSRRIASRFGGFLELNSRPSGGTRAVLDFPEPRP